MTREEKLIQKIKQGDRDAASELAAIYYPEILRYCLWHARDRSLAEDITQETFLKAIRHFDSYTHKGRLRPFLYRIAANTCIDFLRKTRPPDLSLEESAIDIPCRESGFEEVRSDMVLRQLVAGLPAPQQEIVLLRFGHDLTMRETAETLNLPLRTVQSRLRAALKQLKKDFENGKGGTL